jgi:hypothetical protein
MDDCVEVQRSYFGRKTIKEVPADPSGFPFIKSKTAQQVSFCEIEKSQPHFREPALRRIRLLAVSQSENLAFPS